MVGRKPRPGESWCPVCGVTLRPGELETHLTHELDKLVRLPQSRPLSQRTPTPTTSTPTTSTTPTPSSSSAVTSVAASVTSPLSPHPVHARARDPGWDTYQRVRANRQVRLRAKKRRSGRSDECGPACPVCGERVSAATPEDLHAHVESCLRRSGGVLSGLLQGGGEDEVVDVEGDGPYEEYEWCGQRRVRASSLLRPQPPLLVALRGAPDCHKINLFFTTPADRHREGGSERSGDSEMTSGGGVMEGSDGGSRVEPMSVELEALKEKVRVLERDGAAPSKFLCLVCQTEYDRPAVSVVCWHVLCEACWAHTLGVKSECPQCSQSVSPEDLRPIHL
ncbi:E3 ubiquitin-protein ligase RNF220-like [Homarus americanus]|uniref:E3 ubiquitin-protein ligase RNF220-like n=1 Tax=Homarus americanus TaxID=6706 RepID=A0A8J5N4T0_HOMAM|nr:E3 ubiquitin-protein ligase RNF220-like [Homarus americanus]